MDLAEGEYNEWDYEEEEQDDEDDDEQEIFPIGYTIEFSAEDRDPEEEDHDAGQVARGGLGSQALPVSNTLRADWDGIPTDGAEYLFTTRSQGETQDCCKRESIQATTSFHTSNRASRLH
ncbi:hypothetical protein Pst134EA_000768 [Puccinia striiformis f. sp. tritici]|uniref:hypothetical protein n=1 Tax=Puccinia striiformis f. sp. tritici TaxID=168172 RepID=UPI0020088206|nr:hypothetical protein Pst134EA_000768 [Puccinia striiformis f. sp. tritici]KAH9473690.1 hypothetical protein Pst134EA_000768 [Puccinia striiformis f. sp. tritici]